MSEVNFQPLFEYLDSKFSAVEKEQAETKESINTLSAAVDAYLKQDEAYR